MKKDTDKQHPEFESECEKEYVFFADLDKFVLDSERQKIFLRGMYVYKYLPKGCGR